MERGGGEDEDRETERLSGGSAVHLPNLDLTSEII